jgi:23S rRNA (guanine745-N1)-methyltransferase
MKNAIICPVCGEGLTFTEKTAVCPNRHSFDRAKEGSVNLILNGSPTSGDDPKMVSARKNFSAADITVIFRKR